MPATVPWAVKGDGSPLPPRTVELPTTQSVSRRMYSMSVSVMPTSSAVM